MIRMLVLALQLAVVVISCCSASQQHTERYITSKPIDSCPLGHFCHTLFEYLLNTTVHFTSNTTLHFLTGNHSAVFSQPTTLPVVISDVSNLALVGPEVGPGEPPLASIWCDYTVQFRISNSHNVTLQDLDIHAGLRYPQSRHVHFIHNSERLALCCSV